MDDSLANCYKTLHPAIGSRWTELLRAAPPAPPATCAVITPDMLGFLVDETLDHMCDRLQQAGWRPPAHHAPLPCGLRFKSCACGLHVMLTFYTTGAQALHETLPENLGHTRLQIMQCFNELAHADLAGLCGACHYRDGRWCRLRDAAGNDRSAAIMSASDPGATQLA